MKVSFSCTVIPAKAGTHFELRQVLDMSWKGTMGPGFRRDDELMPCEGAEQ
jgi:hypothetical protein